MKASDLDLRELLSISDDGGRITLGASRALLLDASALGVLRAELIEQLGWEGARGVLLRFGYVHGWRTAESLERGFAWADPSEWQRAGSRLHTLQGLVRVEGVEGQGEGGRPRAEALWHDSYEAEQHVLHRGQADEPVCWTLTGFASGYLSRCHGEAVVFFERQCVGRGDAVCRVEGRLLREWGGSAEAEERVAVFQGGCLEASLLRVTGALKVAERRLRAQRQRLEEPLEEELDGVVARSDGMRRAVELARRAARVDSNVLVVGESGVGKERVARLVHEQSGRVGGPFVAINCGAISEALVESELFGHVAGAFTGATQDRLGLFEAAKGGTLFLDEVGELPLATQVKLLRVLQEREVRRVGENVARPVDVRLVAATHRDLKRGVAEGSFREDLYYRLRVVEVVVPPLRERPEDVLPLARVSLARLCERLQRRVFGFAPEVADALRRYRWPGNVRELENAVERAVVVAEGERVQLVDLPEEVRGGIPRGEGRVEVGEVRPLREVERAHILAALEAFGGKRGETAAALGIGTATLYRKLREYEREGT